MVRTMAEYIDREVLLQKAWDADEIAKITNNSDKGGAIMTKDAYEMFELISNVYFGKQYYFEDKNDMVYSRLSHSYMSKDDALNEFLDEIQSYE